MIACTKAARYAWFICIFAMLSSIAFAGGELASKKRYVEVEDCPPVVVLPPLLPAPTQKTTMHKVLWYVPNRALDLVDVFRFNVGYGKGIGANAHATRYLEAGYANYNSTGIALVERDIHSYECTVQEAGARLANFQTGTLIERDSSEIGLEAHALVGGGVGVSLDQAVDFVVGIFLLDPAGDDN